MKKIKQLCDHEYEYKITINDFKQIGKYAVMRGFNTLYAVCLVCEHEETMMVAAGYAYLGGGNDDNG